MYYIYKYNFILANINASIFWTSDIVITLPVLMPVITTLHNII